MACLLREPPRSGILARKSKRPRPYVIRKPREYRASKPGELVQADTLDVRPIPRQAFKHFTVRDVISRWDVIEVRRRATAATAAEFLDPVLKCLFSVKAIQVDGGSEFRAVSSRPAMSVLPPHSPRLNDSVERAHRTNIEEFYVTTTAILTCRHRGPLFETGSTSTIPHDLSGPLRVELPD